MARDRGSVRTGQLTALESGGAALPGAGGSGALPTDGDRIVLTGTVRTCSYDEIVKMLGIPDPLPAVPGDEGSEAWFRRNATYHVIVLDAPQTLSLGDPASWDGTGTSFPYRSGEVMMISIHALDNMDQYEGRHITFSIEPDTTRWPYDYVLPGGQPLTEDIHILD